MVQKQGSNRFLLSSLTLGVSSIDPSTIVISICLIDIANTYTVSLSIAGQLRTAASTVGIAAALAMGAISTRYNYKHILLAGLLLNVVSALGCALVPGFGLLFVVTSAFGLVSAMVSPMTDSFIGEHYTGERRSRAWATMFALRTLSYLIMVQLIGYVATWWGWRRSFMFLVAPYSLLALFFASAALPGLRGRSRSVGGSSLFEGYSTVLSSRSAKACLLGSALASAAWGGMITYNTSYMRDMFRLPMGQASLVLSGLALGVLIGSYSGAGLVNRYGGKRLGVATLATVGLLMVAWTNFSSLPLTLVVLSAMSLAGGIRFTATNTLTLGQVPEARGTMMSVNTAANSLGWALGAAVGGLALLEGWWLVGAALGAASIIAALFYHFWTAELVTEGD